jgi:hypothetical protein
MRRFRQVGLVSLLLSLSCVTASGCNDCDFVGRRCAGNAVEQCGGVDQQVGRGITRTACEGVNPVCVQPSAEVALCAVAADKRCTTGERRCDGNTLVQCKDGFEVALDCTKVTRAVPSGQPPATETYSCTAPTAGAADCRPG